MSDWRSRAKPVGDWRSRAKFVAADGKPMEIFDSGDTAISPDQITQVMHPDISMKDRAIVKNFAAGTKPTIDYLKKEYPKLDVVEQDGEILIRTPGEAKWNVLDPSAGSGRKDVMFPDPRAVRWTDLPGDALDIGADVVSGITTTAGAALGGGAAGVATGGAGVLPGAMAGAGAAGTATEAARQKIGQSLGIPQEVSVRDALTAGGLSAASVGLFGAGKPTVSAVNALTRKLGEDGTKEAAQKLLQQSGRGVLERGYDTVTRRIAPRIASAASGESVASIKNMANHLDDIQRAEANPQFADEASAFARDLEGKIQGRSSEIGAQLASDIDQAGGKVNVAEVKALFNKRLAELQRRQAETDTPAIRSQINAVKGEYDKYFGLAGGKDELNTATMRMMPKPTEIPDEISATTAWNLQKDMKGLSKAASAGQGIAGRLPEGTAASDQMLSDAAMNAYHMINSELDNASQGLSTVSKDKYKRLMDLRRRIEPAFSTDRKAVGSLRSMDANSQVVTREALESLKNEFGIDVMDEANRQMAIAKWSNPSMMSLSGGGTTSTSRTVPLGVAGGMLGGALGWGAGGGAFGSGAGAMLGAGLGTVAGGPRAIRAYTSLGQKAEKALSPLVRPVIDNGGVTSGVVAPATWEWLQQRPVGD